MPSVSIIVPCYNEQATIQYLLGALYKQTYPRTDMEVIIADGLSSDQTREKIAEFESSHPDFRVTVVDNDQRTIPAGLNRAIGSASGEFIVRLDAHSVPYPDYVARCVDALSIGRGDNVGGVWEICPGSDSWVARAISVAASHPLGVGDARYRVGGNAQIVDTVPFGAYRRELVERIGGYDERLLTNEDYEFNVRIRQSGGRVWFDPMIRSRYFARPDFDALARQYWRYGFWKARMIRRYPKTLRWRQLLPPLFVLSVLVLLVLGFIFPALHWLLLIGIGFYILALAFAGLGRAIRMGDFLLSIGVPLAIGTMHLCWGSAFLFSLVSNGKRSNSAE